MSIEACSAPLRVGDQDDLAAARRHLLHVRDGLLENAVVRRDDDDRHVLVDQRDRPVLQLAGGIAFGVDVGDFLELQRAFHGEREVGVAAEIEHVAIVREFARHLLDLRLELQHLAGDSAAFRQARAPAPSPRPARSCRAPRRRATASEASTESWQVKALVEATPISGPASVGSIDVGFARDGRFAHVDDRADRHARLAAVAQRGQRVGGLARLRNEERRAALRDRHLAIAELGGDIDVDRQAREALEPVFADEAAEIGGAAGRNRQAVESWRSRTAGRAACTTPAVKSR